MAGGDRKNADVALVTALAGGATVQEAARSAGVSESTVYRRLNDGVFRQRVAEARSEMLSRAVGTLARVSTAAAVTLAQLLKAEAESVRLGAARSVLEMAVKFHETEQLEQRIAQLEEQAAASTPGEGVRRWPA